PRASRTRFNHTVYSDLQNAAQAQKREKPSLLHAGPIRNAEYYCGWVVACGLVGPLSFGLGCGVAVFGSGLTSLRGITLSMLGGVWTVPACASVRLIFILVRVRPTARSRSTRAFSYAVSAPIRTDSDW